jgi:hypothetical protein
MPAENMPQLMRYGDKPLFQVQPLVECDTVCRNRSTGDSSVRRGILVCELPDAAAVSKEPIICRTHRQRTLGRGRACVAESLSALLKTYFEGPLSSQVGQQPLQNARGQGPSNSSSRSAKSARPLSNWMVTSTISTTRSPGTLRTSPSKKDTLDYLAGDGKDGRPLGKLRQCRDFDRGA